MKKVILATLVLVVLVVLAESLQATSSPVPRPQKSIVIYLLSQSLACYEDTEIVYTTRVCTGRGWHTEKWTKYKRYYWIRSVQGPRSRCIIRGKYNVLAPHKMILSEEPDRQVGKLVRMHEYHDVPEVASSNGCIRIPLGKGKPINEWVKNDLPVPVIVELAYAPKIDQKTKPQPSPKPTVKTLSKQQSKRTFPRQR